jgi:hypothetical protein
MKGKEIVKSLIVSLAATLACSTISQAAPDTDLPTNPEETALQEEAIRDAEEQVQQTREQVRQVQTQIKEASKEASKAWKEAAKAMRLAQSATAFEPDDLSEDIDQFEHHFEAFSSPLTAVKDKLFALAAPARVAAKPLIVRSEEAAPAVQASIEEDLAVMTRILNKATAERGAREEHEWAMGIALSSVGGGARRPQSIYLEGYGALFLLNVKYPLVEPPKKGVEEEKSEEAVDSEWEQTKEELFGDRLIRRRGSAAKPFVWREGPAMDYEAERVAELKKNVLDALKNANNIRDLKPDEFITVAITGPSNATRTSVRRVYRNERPLSKSDREERDVVTVLKADKELLANETHLIVRVKKADVDAFAKGTLKLEDFEKKASLVTY